MPDEPQPEPVDAEIVELSPAPGSTFQPVETGDTAQPVETGYTPDGVPTFESVREKIECGLIKLHGVISVTVDVPQVRRKGKCLP